MLEFDKNKVVGTANIGLKTLTEYHIEIIMVTALEGGIPYWAGLDNSKPEWDDQPEDEPNSTWATKILLDGGSVKFYDIEEDEDDSNWILTLEKLIDGYAKNFVERPWDNDIENGDAITADCIVQYALFGEIVYS